MNVRFINPTNIVIGVVFPPTKAEKTDLTQIHAAVVGRFDRYDSYAFLPPAGAKISEEGVGDILIQPDKVQFLEEIRNTPFQNIKEKAVEIFRIVFGRVKPPVFLVMGVKLIALIDLFRPGAAVEFIDSKMLSAVKKEQLDVLGPALQGAGIRFHMLKEQPLLAGQQPLPQAQYDLRIEPFFKEKSNLYVELDAQFPGPFPHVLDVLEGRIELAAGYLKNDVREFLGSF